MSRYELDKEFETVAEFARRMRCSQSTVERGIRGGDVVVAVQLRNRGKRLIDVGASLRRMEARMRFGKRAG